MKINGWLLNADYVTKNESPIIRLWIKRDNGEVGVALEKNFEPYFYAVPEKEKEIKKLRNQIKNHKTTRYSEKITPKKVLIEDKKDLGEPIKALRIIVNHPQQVPSFRKSISEIDGVKEVRESDIPFVSRYIIDRGLKPSSGVKIEGKKTSKKYCDFSIEIQNISPEKREGTPPFKTMAFDCEMLNKGGTPNSEEDPIIIISTKIGSKDPQLLKINGEDDSEVISDFVELINKEDPDLIVTFNGDDFDWPYIKDRADLHGISLEVGRDNSKPNWRGRSRGKVSIKGRLNVDLYRIAERDIGEVKMLSLEEVADYLGVMEKEKRCNIEGSEIGKYWENSEKRKKLLKYSKDDVISTYGIAKELVPNQIEISKMTRQYLDKVSKMGRGRQVEWYLMAEAYSENELIPNKGDYGARAKETYSGGFVLEPKKGLHEDVVSLDFSSMYPSLMVSYNVSPDTLIQEESENLSEEDYNEAPQLNYKFKKEPEGFFKSILKNLIQKRSEIKREMKKTEDKQNQRLLNIRQKALKTLTNSFYGYTGWNAARWYKKECAEATTAWGREMIKKAIETAKSQNFQVLYSDTDSIFIKHKDKGEKIQEKATDLANELTRELPLLLEVEDYFKTIFFTEKKKRYAGLKSNGEMYIRGLEVRRGDWCKLAKQIQKKVISEILNKKDPDLALKLVQETIKNIKEGKIPFDELIIRKTLKKKIKNYKSKQAHVRAAEKAKRKGYKIKPGGKVGFVVIARKGETIGDRAYPITMIEEYEKGKVKIEGMGGSYSIDKDYYINNQIIPAVSRILNYFGYTKNELKDQPTQRTFGEFN